MPPSIRPPTPSRWPEVATSAAKWAAVVTACATLVASCGAAGAGAAQALAASNAAVTRRLDSIEGKLDDWRGEQQEAKAQAGANDKAIADLRSRLGGLEEIVRSYRQECAAVAAQKGSRP